MEMQLIKELDKKRPSWFVETVIIAAAYALTAKLSFAMAGPPGNVTVVWPPSGIALAVILILGERVWLGVWLGSFAATRWFFSGIADPFAVQTLVNNVTIATGL